MYFIGILNIDLHKVIQQCKMGWEDYTVVSLKKQPCNKENFYARSNRFASTLGLCSVVPLLKESIDIASCCLFLMSRSIQEVMKFSFSSIAFFFFFTWRPQHLMSVSSDYMHVISRFSHGIKFKTDFIGLSFCHKQYFSFNL